MVTMPGPKSLALARRLGAAESPNVTYLSKEFPIFWQSARGCAVRDVDGKSYLDLTSGFAVASLGYNARAVRAAIRTQASRIWHGMGDVHPNDVKVELLEALAQITPGKLSVSILSNSGAEAVESALKTALLYTGKPRVLAFEGAYHGLTYGTLPVTHRSDFKRPFQRQIANIAVFAPYPDSLHGPDETSALERVERMLKKDKSIGAILVEPIQGRGGVRAPQAFFLQELRRLAKRHDVLMIADEIFTGFGRTGKRFAVDHSGVVPDLLCVGKALANGFPISACVGTRDIMRAWPVSAGEAIHTSTFLGNPLGCAMAVASIRELEKRNLAKRAAQVGKRWMDRLFERFGRDARVGEIRGRGLMIGIELVMDRKSLKPNAALAARVMKAALRKGLILLTGGSHGNVLTLTPPLIISEKELTRATDILEGVLKEI